jgi:hypothetical protein
MHLRPEADGKSLGNQGHANQNQKALHPTKPWGRAVANAYASLKADRS